MICAFAVGSCLYGCLGIFGILKICPKKYRGTGLEGRYRRFEGIAFLILGTLWLAGILLIEALSAGQIALLALPAVAFALIGDFRYRLLLKKEQ